jgi:hypothetical protein
MDLYKLSFSSETHFKYECVNKEQNLCNACLEIDKNSGNIIEYVDHVYKCTLNDYFTNFPDDPRKYNSSTHKITKNTDLSFNSTSTNNITNPNNLSFSIDKKISDLILEDQNDNMCMVDDAFNSIQQTRDFKINCNFKHTDVKYHKKYLMFSSDFKQKCIDMTSSMSIVDVSKKFNVPVKSVRRWVILGAKRIKGSII